MKLRLNLLEKIEAVQYAVNEDRKATDARNTDDEKHWMRVCHTSLKLAWYAIAKARGQKVSLEEFSSLLEELNRETTDQCKPVKGKI